MGMSNPAHTATAADLELARIGIQAMIDFMAAELNTDRATAFAAMRANADSPKMRQLITLASQALAAAA